MALNSPPQKSLSHFEEQRNLQKKIVLTVHMFLWHQTHHLNKTHHQRSLPNLRNRMLHKTLVGLSVHTFIRSTVAFKTSGTGTCSTVCCCSRSNEFNVSFKNRDPGTCSTIRSSSRSEKKSLAFSPTAPPSVLQSASKREQWSRSEPFRPTPIPGLRGGPAFSHGASACNAGLSTQTYYWLQRGTRKTKTCSSATSWSR